MVIEKITRDNFREKIAAGDTGVYSDFVMAMEDDPSLAEDAMGSALSAVQPGSDSPIKPIVIGRISNYFDGKTLAYEIVKEASKGRAPGPYVSAIHEQREREIANEVRSFLDGDEVYRKDRSHSINRFDAIINSVCREMEVAPKIEAYAKEMVRKAY